MEVNPICRDWSPPSEAISASACSEKGSRPSSARSAPRRLFDCVRMLDCKLSRNEKAMTMDATPRMTQDMERTSGFSPRRASRSAMLQTHFLKTDFIIANLLTNVQHSTTYSHHKDHEDFGNCYIFNFLTS